MAQEITIRTRTSPPGSSVPVGTVPGLAPAAWRWIGATTGLLLVALLAFDTRYGFHRDELYFRMLGRDLSWGYFDQPPLAPLLAKISIGLFGDGQWAIRLPGALCLAAAVMLMALIARELGGGSGAQLLAMVGLAVAPYPLAAGNALITNVIDLPLWLGTILFALRAVGRADGRWWVGAGAMAGLATYNKYLIVFLVAGLAAGLLAAGPRQVFADRRLWAGAALAMLLAAPNLGYQATHGWPQLEMTGALSADFGMINRAMFVPLQFLLIGPMGAVVVIVGWIRLVRTPRLRAFAIAYPAAGLLVLAGGGRADYVFGLVLLGFAAGAVGTARWLSGRRARLGLVLTVATISAVVGVLGSLSPLPLDVVRRTPLPVINAVLRDSVGWPAYVRQIADAYNGLPAADRARATVVVSNFGEAGALDRYGRELGLPTAYSGHNELYEWGPPPAGQDIAVTVGLRAEVLRTAFQRCDQVGRLDSGTGIKNKEQDRAILVCRGLRAPWKALWPGFRHAHTYG